MSSSYAVHSFVSYLPILLWGAGVHVRRNILLGYSSKYSNFLPYLALIYSCFSSYQVRSELCLQFFLPCPCSTIACAIIVCILVTLKIEGFFPAIFILILKTLWVYSYVTIYLILNLIIDSFNTCFQTFLFLSFTLECICWKAKESNF